MIRECFIVEDGVRYSEVNGARMLSDLSRMLQEVSTGSFVRMAEEYPYLLKSEEEGQPKRQIRLIDGQLYFLLRSAPKGKPYPFPKYEKTYVYREVEDNASAIQKCGEGVEIIGYFNTKVDKKPDSYLLYWCPIKKDMLME